MISIRKCPICKKEFDAIVGDPLINCPDCQNFICDFEIYFRTEGSEEIGEFEETEGIDEFEENEEEIEQISNCKEIDISDDIFQAISQIPTFDIKSDHVYTDFAFEKKKTIKSKNKG